MMQLAFAAALMAATWLGWRWCSRAADGSDAWAPIARAFPVAAALAWAYIATAVASAHTWRLGLPGASEIVVGGVLAVAGAVVVGAAAWAARGSGALDRPRAAAGLVVLLAGIALIGDSGYGLLLAAAFAALSAVIVGRRERAAATS